VALVAVPDARVTDLAAPISQAEIAVIAVPWIHLAFRAGLGRGFGFARLVRGDRV
jgi:hypothetical protein